MLFLVVNETSFAVSVAEEVEQEDAPAGLRWIAYPSMQAECAINTLVLPRPVVYRDAETEGTLNVEDVEEPASGDADETIALDVDDSAMESEEAATPDPLAPSVLFAE